MAALSTKITTVFEVISRSKKQIQSSPSISLVGARLGTVVIKKELRRGEIVFIFTKG